MNFFLIMHKLSVDIRYINIHPHSLLYILIVYYKIQRLDDN